MVILIWLLFEIILFFSISVINIILKSASYIERSILTYLITAIIYLIFIFFLKIKTVIKMTTTVKKYLSYILMGIGICLFHRVIFLLFPNIAISTFKNMGLEEYLQVQYSFRNPFIFLYICIIGPILEELFYRGKLLNICLKKRKPEVCVLLISILFGISHMNLVQFMNAFCLGILCGLVYIKSKDIKAPIMIHLVNNLYSGISSLTIELYETTSKSLVGMVSSVIIGLFLLLFGIWIFVNENKIKSTYNNTE